MSIVPAQSVPVQSQNEEAQTDDCLFTHVDEDVLVYARVDPAKKKLD